MHFLLLFLFFFFFRVSCRVFKQTALMYEHNYELILLEIQWNLLFGCIGCGVFLARATCQRCNNKINVSSPNVNIKMKKKLNYIAAVYAIFPFFFFAG